MWTVTTDQPGTTYTYQISAIDYHYNWSAATNLVVTTPPANAANYSTFQRGLRPTNSYWGGAGEQIDVYNGNLNYSVPLITAMGRGGLNATFKLVYNSQNWVVTNGTTSFAETMDTGYGFGWQLMLGSVMPIYNGNHTLEYWYTDSSGGQYRLALNNNGVWTGNASFYAWYDSNTNRLWFRDGSFWLMGCTAAGGEPDAGTMYPTLIEDSNGNQIIIRYLPGVGANWNDSSSRISSIEDARAVSYTDSGTGDTLYRSYSFSYNTGASGLSYLSSITSYVNTPENYTFTINQGQPLYSPSGISFSTTSYLAGITVAGLGYSYNFTYDGTLNDGDLTQVQVPQGGHLRWAYQNCSYAGPQTIREVQYRYLLSNTGGSEDTYTFTPGNGTSTTLDDPTGAERYWAFTGGWLSEVQYRPSHGATAIRHEYYTWVQEPASLNFYIGTLKTVLDEGKTYSQTTQTVQTQDSYGNILTSNLYDYGNLSTPARSYSNTYLHQNNSNYTSRYIVNRLLTSTLTSVTPSLTLISNTYDGTALSSPATQPREWDLAYVPAFPYRGNVTKTVSPGKTVNMTYDSTGTTTSSDDNNGHFVSVTTSPATNYTLPDKLDPNGTGQLLTQATYNPSFAPASVAIPGQIPLDPVKMTGNAPYTHYDSLGRVDYTFAASQGNDAGPKSTYGYSYTPGQWTITTTTYGQFATSWNIRTSDGLGRETKTQTGYGTTTVSTVDTAYAPCACSPLGKMNRQSQPYAPTDAAVYTNYTYDALGRTVTVTLPDGASKTQYIYQGNVVTVTDPAGKWKQYASDAFGNLRTVLEPDPTASPVPSPPNPPPAYPLTTAPAGMLLTSYSYDQVNHLTNVSMPRNVGGTLVTQTRSFNYDSTTLRLMSAVNPENGTVSYTYNADGTPASKIDANGGKETYHYDSYKRLDTIHRFPNGTTEDTSQRQSFTYGGIYLTQATTASMVGPNQLTFQDGYVYTPAGKVANHTLTIRSANHTNQSVQASTTLQMAYSYDTLGGITAVSIPQGQGWLNYTYTLDALERPTTLTDSNGGHWASGVTYNAANQLTGGTFGSASQPASEARTYNSLLQLTQVRQTNNGGANVLMDMTYTYSPNYNNGQITSSVDAVTGETVSYQYDALKRLLSASSNKNWSEAYTYDGFGNLLNMTPTGSAPILNVTMDPATNRLQATGVSYDSNGNVTSVPYPSGSLVYDMANRLVAVNWNLWGQAFYAYGVKNERIYSRDASGTETIYLYGGYGEKLATYTITGIPEPANTIQLTQQSANVYFAGRLISAEGNLVVTDRLGSVRWGGPNSLGHQAQYPYGVEYSPTTVNDREKYATYTRDSVTGFDYAVNRYYSSMWGRFLSPDLSRKGIDPGNPQSWNRYAYVLGDPINSNDVDGLGGPCDPLNGATYEGSAPANSCSMPAFTGIGPTPTAGDLYASAAPGASLNGSLPTAPSSIGTVSGELAAGEANYVLGTVVPGYMQSALNSNPVVTQAVLPPGAVSATITFGQQQQQSAIISALTVLPRMFYSGFVDMLLNDNTTQGALEIAGSIAAAVGPKAVANALAPATLYHFTSAEAGAAIQASGTIYPGGGLFGSGVYGSAFNSPAAATLMGARSVQAVIAFSGAGAVASAWGPFVMPGAYRVLAPLTIFGGVTPLPWP